MVFVDHILLDWIGDKYKMATQYTKYSNKYPSRVYIHISNATSVLFELFSALIKT